MTPLQQFHSQLQKMGTKTYALLVDDIVQELGYERAFVLRQIEILSYLDFLKLIDVTQPKIIITESGRLANLNNCI